LVYAARDLIANVPLPEPSALRQALNQMRQRAADKLILERNFPAKPEPLKCGRCSVRARCESYWELSESFRTHQSDQSEFADYAPTTGARVEFVAQGTYIRDTFGGRASYLYLPNDALLNVRRNFKRIRILSIKPDNDKETVRLGITRSSEVYVF
jgi:hypothetical protein